MQNRPLVARFVALTGAALMSVAMTAQLAHAQQSSQPASVNASFADQSKETRESLAINVLVGQSRVINFDRPIGRFSVSNPEVAEAVLVAPDQVLVNGKAFGQVNFIAWEQKGGEFVVFDVFVRANLSLIDSQMRALFPKDDIRLSQANGSVVLSGSVSDAKTSTQAEAVVQAAGFKTVNMLQTPVNTMAQVQLQVRVAEVSRNRGRALSTSFASANNGTSLFNSTNGPANLTETDGGVMKMLFSGANLFFFNNAIGTQAYIHALQTQGALRMLAEPNLIAMDGQQASFLAGGEFPIPVVQNGGGGSTASVTVEFKAYGVRLNFKPTIIDEDHIRLELEPEVSTIDFSNGVKLNGFLIPALKTRRAKTGIELRDGQAFALAGLLDNSEARTMSKVPVLGDIPVIGALFKSKDFQKSETELMFIVTANLVKPVNRDDLPQWRGIDGLKNGSPLGVEPKDEGIKGDHGFSTGTGATETTSITTAPATPAATAAPQIDAKPAKETTTKPVALPAVETVSFMPPASLMK